jgi:cytochrome c553
VVHPTLTATALAKWYLAQPDKDVAAQELRERCEEMVGICIQCHGRFLDAAGVNFEKNKN